MSKLVHAVGVIAIPQGHEVEVVVYAVEEGVFSKAWVPRTSQPLVIDRTAGITYGQAWLFQEINAYVAGEARPDLPLEVRRDLREHSRLRGTVRACRIAWIGTGHSSYPQTTLVVDEE